jgi:CRISPR/Cas system CSM-associated protein Csm3 (group 7 of RAMP superfamily)
MKINYKIEILSEWHIGSGLDAGVEADLVVLKDEDGLPYIPGKTIKGLLKDASYEIMAVKQINKDDFNFIFGWEEKDENNKVIKTHSGKSFFSNAELSEAEKKEISSNNLSEFLYKNIASTKIDKNGIAQSKSLRTIEVCMPVTLWGEITIDEEKQEYKELFEKAFKWTRSIGVNRNRGLGRCRFVLTENH